MKNLVLPGTMRDKDVYGFFDDFEWYISPHRWTSLVADTTPTVTIDSTAGTAQGGRLKLYTDTTDNNEVAATTTNKIFKDLDDKPLVFECKIQYAEAATSAANIAVGFGSVMGTANFLLDNGGGPATTYDGHVIYKIDGETVWRCGSSRGTTQLSTISSTTAGGTSAQVLRIEVQMEDASTCTTRYYVDGVQLKDTNGTPIVHTLTLTSAALMQAGFYAKTGSSNAENIYFDYVGAYQVR